MWKCKRIVRIEERADGSVQIRISGGTGRDHREEIPLYRHGAAGHDAGGGAGLCGGEEKGVLGRQAQLLCLCDRKKSGADALFRRRGALGDSRETDPGCAAAGADPRRGYRGDQVFRRCAPGDRGSREGISEGCLGGAGRRGDSLLAGGASSRGGDRLPGIWQGGISVPGTRRLCGGHGFRTAGNDPGDGSGGDDSENREGNRGKNRWKGPSFLG